MQARRLQPMIRIEFAERLLVGLIAFNRELLGPIILFARPETVARILKDRHAWEVDIAFAARMVAPVLHIEDEAPAGVSMMPLVDPVDLAIALHQRDDPLSNRRPAAHRPKDAFFVNHVLGEELGPSDPIFTDHSGLPKMAKGLFDLFEIEAPVRARLTHSAAALSSGQL